MTIPPEVRRATFTLDDMAGTRFDGFTAGQNWNGWACPYFTFETAIRVLRASETIGYKWDFDKRANTFLVRHIQDPEDFEPERFPGVEVTAEQLKITAYPVGAYSWTWDVI